MTEKERMLSGKLYNPYKVNDNIWEKNRETLERFNTLSYKDLKKGMYLLKEIFGHLEDDAVIVPPFYCDKGPQISIGKHFYANTGLLILDEASVRIGNNVFIAPRVCIYTAGHPIDTGVRNMDLEYAKPVTIGNDVWIGGNAVINPGSTIGSNVVIGSGSVVTKDIPDGVVAVGNPCICSKSSYGRTVHMKTDWDPRLYTPVPRGTKKWKETYKNRTCTERVNNRILNNYGLHAMRIHTKKHYSFMTMVICICIHLDAWYKQAHAPAK